MGHNLCRHACVISEAEKKAVVDLSYSRKGYLVGTYSMVAVAGATGFDSRSRPKFGTGSGLPSCVVLFRCSMDLDKFFQETNFEEAEKNAEAIVEKNDSQAVVEQAGDNDCGDGCKI